MGWLTDSDDDDDDNILYFYSICVYIWRLMEWVINEMKDGFKKYQNGCWRFNLHDRGGNKFPVAITGTMRRGGGGGKRVYRVG